MLRSRARRLAVPIGRIGHRLFSAHERFGDCRDRAVPAGCDHDIGLVGDGIGDTRLEISLAIGIDGSFVALGHQSVAPVPRRSGRSRVQCRNSN